jgi:hypothetical protein
VKLLRVSVCLAKHPAFELPPSKTLHSLERGSILGGKKNIYRVGTWCAVPRRQNAGNEPEFFFPANDESIRIESTHGAKAHGVPGVTLQKSLMKQSVSLF